MTDMSFFGAMSTLVIVSAALKKYFTKSKNLVEINSSLQPLIRLDHLKIPFMPTYRKWHINIKHKSNQHEGVKSINRHNLMLNISNIHHHKC